MAEKNSDAVLQAARNVCPRFYETTYHEDGTIASFRPTEEGFPQGSAKELVTDMTDSFIP